MEKSILDLNKAFQFHIDEIDIISNASEELLTEEEFNAIEDDWIPLEVMIDPQTISNHFAILSWIMSLVAQNHTTSYTFYVNKCKELSIPSYNNQE